MIKFELSKKEELAAKKFEADHRHSEIYKGAIGGHLQYRFTPTSLGNAVTVKCSICDVEENITDYDLW